MAQARQKDSSGKRAHLARIERARAPRVYTPVPMPLISARPLPHNSGARRALSLFGVLALLVTQGASTAHEALVPHAWCAEHQELVDVSADAQGSVAVAPAPEGRTISSGRTDLPAVHGEHSHCWVRAHRQDGSSTSPVACAEASTASPLEVCPTLLSATVRVIAVLRVAPKASPPVS